MKKYIKVPAELVSGDCWANSLKLDGCSVIEACIHSMEVQGTIFLEEHLLLFVLEGRATLYYGKQTYVVNKNEMILLKKATSIRYEKEGNPDNDNIYDSLMFCIKDDLLKEFLTMSNVKVTRPEEEIKNSVSPMNSCLVAFAHSLKPYFDNPDSINEGLFRLKIMELLYDVSHAAKISSAKFCNFANRHVQTCAKWSNNTMLLRYRYHNWLTFRDVACLASNVILSLFITHHPRCGSENNVSKKPKLNFFLDNSEKVITFAYRTIWYGFEL